MIPKGNQRSGGQQLATHLLNAFDNERVEVAELRGSVARDLHGAFAEWRAISKATRCRKYLYSLSINPDHRQGPFAREDYFEFIQRTENKLGLAGQPRAVVFHVKDGREHAHVVWSRIDPDRLRAVQLSHDRQKLRAVAQEYARDRGIELPPGMSNDRGKERFKDREKNVDLADKQHEERTGIGKEERRQAITEAWRSSDNSKSFLRALTERGYFVARGDRRSFVVVDLYGEVHSLARQIEGVKSSELKARLADQNPDSLPDIEAARRFAAERRAALRSDDPQPLSVWQRRANLQQAQAKRRAALEEKRQALEARQERERKELAAAHQRRDRAVIRARNARKPTGLLAYLVALPGIRHYWQARRAREDRQRQELHNHARQMLQRAHDRQHQDFQRHYRSLEQVEKRERQSLEARLRRERLNELGRRQGPRRQPSRPQDREQATAKEPFNEAARAGHERTRADGSKGPATAPERERGAAKDTFTRAAGGGKEPTAPPDRTEADSPRPGSRDDHATGPAGAGKVSEKLADALRDRAARKRQEREADRRKKSDPDRTRDDG